MITEPLRIGIETLLDDPAALSAAGNIGLVSHRAARLSDGRASAEALYASPGCRLKALFGPEHGFGADRAAGVGVAHVRHPAWGIPVWSLYGRERRPRAEMLRGLDLLIVDLQTLPFRPYTYLATLKGVMIAAAEHGLPVLVADRPVPMPSTIDGPVPEGACDDFICSARLPMAYGMTLAESARWLSPRLPRSPELRVAAMRGYRRESRRGTGWPPWSPPSPAIRSWTNALCYLITVFCEALPLFTNDRRGPRAFRRLYGPPEWADDAVKIGGEYPGIPGLRIGPAPPEAASGRPGISLTVSGCERLRPVAAAIEILWRAQRVLGAERLWRHPGARTEWFDRLFGTPVPRLELQAGRAPKEIAAAWQAESEAFAGSRRTALLYSARNRASRQTGGLSPKNRGRFFGDIKFP